MCGNTGCDVGAWNQSRAWIQGTLSPAGVPVDTAAIEAAASSALVPLWSACERDPFYRGATAASVSNGNVTWSVFVDPTQDLYTNPYARTRGACIIEFTVTYF